MISYSRESTVLVYNLWCEMFSSFFTLQKSKKVNMERVDQYIKEVSNNQNAHNLAQFVKAYMK